MTARRIAYTVFFIAAFNSLLCFTITISIGGDAWNGRAEEGRYYVSDHGKETEVSKAIWYANRVHIQTVVATHVAAMAAALWLYQKWPTSS